MGAGAVVTKSFPDENCIVAGNPAKVKKRLADISPAMNKFITPQTT